MVGVSQKSHLGSGHRPQLAPFGHGGHTMPVWSWQRNAMTAPPTPTRPAIASATVNRSVAAGSAAAGGSVVSRAGGGDDGAGAGSGSAEGGAEASAWDPEQPTHRPTRHHHRIGRVSRRGAGGTRRFVCRQGRLDGLGSERSRIDDCDRPWPSGSGVRRHVTAHRLWSPPLQLTDPCTAPETTFRKHCL
jgi:hypothetical protein